MTITNTATPADSYRVHLGKAAGWGAGALAAGAGLPYAAHYLTKGAIPAFELHMLGMGTGFAAGAAALAITRPESKGAAMAIGGGAGLVGGALGGVFAMRQLGGYDPASTIFGGVMGGMVGGAMGLASASIVGA